ncbi:MAG: hypothetical protein E7466_03875 [Ruminococcaceae bacterium]|nr:hypothetical protein [Oscillospiraceae bacterium]
MITRPVYYDQFQCLAGACPDSCCQEWEVDIDPRSAVRYLSLSGSLGDEIRQWLTEGEDGWFLRLNGNRCPMWRPDGLCQIQHQLGHDGLCQVCQNFPRLRHDYGTFIELGLELSCPEAARLILKTPAQPLLSEPLPQPETPDYDTDAMDILLRTRQTALKLLEYGSVTEGLTLLLLYGYHAQELLDSGEERPFSAAAAMEFASTIAQGGSLSELCQLYQGLEILTPRWAQLLAAPNACGNWPEEIRSMARYGIGRHWLQAVSDYDLACRVKMIVTGCILVNGLGGNPVDTAQLWSKEIENSAENLESLLDAAYQSPLVTDAKLLGLLSHCHSSAC